MKQRAVRARRGPWGERGATPPKRKEPRKRFFSSSKMAGKRGAQEFELDVNSNNNNKNPAVTLLISGSDSGGGAGQQADMKTACAYGVYAASTLTAITAQNSSGVHAISTVEPELISAQIAAVVSGKDFSHSRSQLLFQIDFLLTLVT